MLQSLYDSGAADLIYYVVWVLAVLLWTCISLYCGRKYGEGVKKLLPVAAIVLVAQLAITWLLYQMTLYVRGSGVLSVVRSLVYLPLVLLLCSKLFKIKWGTLCDIVAPGICAAQGVGSAACIFTGCCHGYPFVYGIYNPVYEMRMFPVQLCEMGTSLLIAFYLIVRAKESNYTTDGKSFPFMLMLFGTARFMWEFFRNNTKILWRCSDVGLHALFMVLVGAVAFICLYFKDKRGTIRS